LTIFSFCFALGEPEAVDPAFYIENLIEMEMKGKEEEEREEEE
jgi:hypothetical protein